MPEYLHLETDAGPAHEDVVPTGQLVMPVKSSRDTTDMVDAAQDLIGPSRRCARRRGNPGANGRVVSCAQGLHDSRVAIPHTPPTLGMTLWGDEHPRLDSPPPLSHRITLGIF